MREDLSRKLLGKPCEIRYSALLIARGRSKGWEIGVGIWVYSDGGTYWAWVGGAWDGVLALVLELTAGCKAAVFLQ